MFIINLTFLLSSLYLPIFLYIVLNLKSFHGLRNTTTPWLVVDLYAPVS